MTSLGRGLRLTLSLCGVWLIAWPVSGNAASLQIGISTSRSNYSSADEIPAIIVLTNVGSEAVVLPRLTEDSERTYIRVNVSDQLGRPVFFFGVDLDTSQGVLSTSTEILEAGKKLTFTRILNESRVGPIRRDGNVVQGVSGTVLVVAQLIVDSGNQPTGGDPGVFKGTITSEPLRIDMVDKASGDLNADGEVGCPDLAGIRNALGKRAGQPEYDPRADLDDDRLIDVRDIAGILRRSPVGVVCGRPAILALDASTLTQTYDGTPKEVTATTSPPGLVVGFIYGDATAAPKNAGIYDVLAIITDGDYDGSASGTLTVGRATPTITWSNPAYVSEGVPLTSAQLNATVNIPGTLTYSPPAGTLLNAGLQTLVVAFAPSDSANYDSATKSVMINVLPTPGEISGTGRTDAGGIRYEFEFRVKERVSGAERGGLKLEVERIGRDNRTNRIGEFITTSLDQVVFSDDPRLRPSRLPRPTIDTATFSGVGRWNGAPAYTFSAEASDAGEPGRGRDLFTITIRSPQGTTMATVSGRITDGNIQSSRLR